MTNTIGNTALELNTNELEMVVGGTPEFSGKVGQYDGVVGQKYYFVRDDNHDIWYYGELTRTWEKGVIWWVTERTHEADIEKSFDGFRGKREFYGKSYSMFTVAKGI